MDSPRLCATFLLFLMSELFEEMPEVGDPDKPELVFFFDEVHLLFNDAPKALLQKVEQVVRLIRSKGVGVYFITQTPTDVPSSVLAQLGNRIQHALRVFTPDDSDKLKKAVKAAATTVRANPSFNTEKAIMELGVGETLVSTLDAKGQPTVVERMLIRPPNSRVGRVTDAERKAVVKASPAAEEYDETADRESASEILQKRTSEQAGAEAAGGDASKKNATGSRSDGFWTTLGKTLIKSAVPAGTRILENAIKRGGLWREKARGRRGWLYRDRLSEPRSSRARLKIMGRVLAHLKSRIVVADGYFGALSSISSTCSQFTSVSNQVSRYLGRRLR